MDSKWLWAKFNASNPNSFHPLLYHLLDTAAVALELSVRRFSPAKRFFITKFFQNCNETDAMHLLALFASLHDIGKATPPFQMKNHTLCCKLKEESFWFPSATPNAPRHELLSQRIIKHEFGLVLDKIIGDDIAKRIQKAAGGHHGYFPNSISLPKIGVREFYGDEKWKNARNAIIKELLRVLNIAEPRQPHRFADGARPLVFQYWLTGFITLCDWIASMERFFPYTWEETIPAEKYFTAAKERAACSLEQCGFYSITDRAPLPEFNKLFPGYEPRTQQAEIIKYINLLNDSNGPHLIIIEAPMGVGKTEAAFICSEILNDKGKKSGAYIAMPTQATSNQMYGRYLSFIKARLPSGTNAAFELLHSASELALENVKAIPAPANVASDDNGEQTGHIEAHDWFRPKKRGLLAPYAVGTVDQALISVLSTKHNYLRLFGLNEKVIIFDEVHSYDVYMSAILKRLLLWAKNYGVSVILLSATLPGAKRNELIAAYATGEPLNDGQYPRLTVANNSGVRTYPLTPTEKKTVILRRGDMSDAELSSLIEKKALEGGRIAVICNTVKRAQMLYTAFRKTPAGKSNWAKLLHARFTAGRRAEIENEVLKIFGKSGTRNNTTVLFSTQIIEQSLDIDFDFMITELCPIDLLLQRAGRLHRFDLLNRPDEMKNPELLWLDQADSFFTNPYNGSPYSRYILLRTQRELKKHESIIVPDDIEPLVESVYAERQCSGNDDVLMQSLEKQFNEKQQKEEETASGKLIPEPATEDEGYYSTEELLDDENPEIHKTLAAATRLGEPSVRTVCIHKREEACCLADRAGTIIDLTKQPEGDTVKKILEAVVPLSGRKQRRGILESAATKPPESWKRNPALRYLRILIFENGTCANGSINIQFDNELGIIYGNLNNHTEEE